MHEAVRIFMRHGMRGPLSPPRERKNYRDIKFHSAGKREGNSDTRGKILKRLLKYPIVTIVRFRAASALAEI